MKELWLFGTRINNPLTRSLLWAGHKQTGISAESLSRDDIAGGDCRIAVPEGWELDMRIAR